MSTRWRNAVGARIRSNERNVICDVCPCDDGIEVICANHLWRLPMLVTVSTSAEEFQIPLGCNCNALDGDTSGLLQFVFEEFVSLRARYNGTQVFGCQRYIPFLDLRFCFFNNSTVPPTDFPLHDIDISARVTAAGSNLFGVRPATMEFFGTGPAPPLVNGVQDMRGRSYTIPQTVPPAVGDCDASGDMTVQF